MKSLPGSPLKGKLLTGDLTTMVADRVGGFLDDETAPPPVFDHCLFVSFVDPVYGVAVRHEEPNIPALQGLWCSNPLRTEGWCKTFYTSRWIVVNVRPPVEREETTCEIMCVLSFELPGLSDPLYFRPDTLETNHLDTWRVVPIFASTGQTLVTLSSDDGIPGQPLLETFPKGVYKLFRCAVGL
jgi:hypothetical protein